MVFHWRHWCSWQLSHRHRLALGLLLVVIRLVTHSDLLLSELRQPLSVDLDSAGDGERWYLVLKNMAHVMKQSSERQHDRGRLQTVPAVQEKLSVFVALSGRL